MLGLLYIDLLREKDIHKRMEIKGKIEGREATIGELEEKKTFMQYVVDTDQKYRDRVFWITENSKNETHESVRKWTLIDRVEIEKRLINELERRNRERSEQPR